MMMMSLVSYTYIYIYEKEMQYILLLLEKGKIHIYSIITIHEIQDKFSFYFSKTKFSLNFFLFDIHTHTQICAGKCVDFYELFFV
jgi:hypothetical protein